MNKQKKLKLILSSLKQKELLKFFQSFLDSIHSKFHKSIKQISFSCYQSTCQVDHFMVNGYGKTSTQALISGINNILDCLVEEEDYSEIIRHCLKKLHSTPITSVNTNNPNTTSKKQLLSTQKTLKTLGPQTSASLQKKTLTMSASLSTNSKPTPKPKSIKDEIFEYFNLDNLKVKNPNNPFTAITPINNPSTKPKGFNNFETSNVSLSKEKFAESLIVQTSTPQSEKFEQVFRRIKEVTDQIMIAEKENTRLKQEIQAKNTKLQPKPSEPTSYSTNQYFTRPSLEGQQKKANPTLTSQSTKKLSYLEMSLNDKFSTKQNYEPPKTFTKPQQPHHQQSNQNHFEKVQISNSFKTVKITENQNNENLKKSINSQDHHSVNTRPAQRKCLVDISNIKTQADEMKISCQKMAEYGSFSTKSKVLDMGKQNSNVSTINYQNNERLSTNSILHPKTLQQQESLSIIESSKKLRSFSVQNSLHDKIGSYGTSHKNPISILSSANMNASFDNGEMSNANANMQRQKMKIPKLNLEILPNYHGRSNKSLNQSLMEHYENKHQTIVQGEN